MAALPAQTPEGEAQAAVGVQADGDLPGRVELALQLDGATQGTGGSVRHLEETRTTRHQSRIRLLCEHIKASTRPTMLFVYRENNLNIRIYRLCSSYVVQLVL